jgi:Xaa-Pro aminopeptidase
MKASKQHSAFDLEAYVRSVPDLGVGLRIPDSEFTERIDTVISTLQDRGLEAGIAYGNEYRPGDTGWLTDYDPSLEATAVIVGRNKVVVLGGPEGSRYAKEQLRLGEFRNLLELKIPEEDYPGYAFTTFADALEEACGSLPSKAGLLTLKDLIPASTYEMFRGVPSVELVDATDILLDLRYRKSESELGIMRVSARIATQAMEAALAVIRPGVTELEVAAAGEYVMKRLGAERFGVITVVASGNRISDVIGGATRKVIENGELLELGMSARYEGLSACVGRTVGVGRIGEGQKRLIEAGLKAYELAAAKIVCGAPTRDADLACRQYFRQFGFENMYSCVHGTGWTECMEYSGAETQYSTRLFPKGIALQLDVGVFGVPAFGLPPDEVGLRLEDLWIIDHAGQVERLTATPLDAQPLVNK